MLRSRLSKVCAVRSVPLLKSYWGGTEPLKLIPYGISSWKYMKENKKFYVDKTSNIRSLEKSGPFNMIQRPRRFGKTLFCDQVHLYYDIAKEPHFKKYFGDTAIGSDPTPNHNKCFILRLNFSEVNAQADDVANHFQDYLNLKLRDFSMRYFFASKPKAYPEVKVNADDYTMTVKNLFEILKDSSGHNLPKIYLIVDDYDALLSSVWLSNVVSGPISDDEQYASSRQLQEAKLTAREQVMETFNRLVKQGVDEGIITRILVTATTPLNAINSPATAALFGRDGLIKNVSQSPEFESALGFSVSDMRKVLPFVSPRSTDYEQHVTLLKAFYNNYRFHPLQQYGRLNPQLCLFYLQELQQETVSPATIVHHQLYNPYSSKMNMLLEDQVISYVLRQYLQGEHFADQVLFRDYPLINFAEGSFQVQLALLSAPMDARDLLTLDGSESVEQQHKHVRAVLSLAYHYGLLTFAAPPPLPTVATEKHTEGTRGSPPPHAIDDAKMVTLVSSNHINRDMVLDALVKQLPPSYPMFHQLLRSYVRETRSATKLELLEEMSRMSVIASAAVGTGGLIRRETIIEKIGPVGDDADIGEVVLEGSVIELMEPTEPMESVLPIEEGERGGTGEVRPAQAFDRAMTLMRSIVCTLQTKSEELKRKN